MNQDSELERYYRLAGISLRTSSTMLAIIFAYTFAVGELPAGLKVYIIIWCILIFTIVLFSAIALFGSKTEFRFVKWSAIIATVILIVTIGGMIALLAWVLFT